MSFNKNCCAWFSIEFVVVVGYQLKTKQIQYKGSCILVTLLDTKKTLKRKQIKNLLLTTEILINIIIHTWFYISSFLFYKLYGNIRF